MARPQCLHSETRVSPHRNHLKLALPNKKEALGLKEHRLSPHAITNRTPLRRHQSRGDW